MNLVEIYVNQQEAVKTAFMDAFANALFSDFGFASSIFRGADSHQSAPVVPQEGEDQNEFD